ncbi:hypothetical protein [Aquirufa aurantiipilula]
MKNKTTFIRDNSREHYTCVSNSIIKSTKLKSEEKDVLIFLLSLPDDWVIFKFQIQKRYQESLSKHKFDIAWKGLKEKGYLTGTKEKDTNGKFNSWRYEVREKPITEILDSEMSENREVENTTSPKQVNIESTLIQNNKKQNTELENTDTSIILEKNNIIQNKQISDIEISRKLNFQGLENSLSNSGLNWEDDIDSMIEEEFIKKYLPYTGDSDDFTLRFRVTSYHRLKNKK